MRPEPANGPAPAGRDSALRRLRRIVTTGSGFALFALGALFLSLFLFFPILLLPVGWERKRRYSRWTLSQALRLYLGYFEFSGLIQPTRFSGLDQLQHRGQLIVASHPSLIDVLFLISMVRGANCIVKSMMWRNPVTIAPVHALGYIRNDAPDLVDRCAGALRGGDSLIIFPEGTRTRDHKPLKFLRGAANIALAAGHDITPVVIRCQPPMLRKGKKWYQVPNRTPRFTIDVYPDMAIEPYLQGLPRSVAARHLTRDLEAFFNRHYSANRPDLKHRPGQTPQ